MTLQETPTPNKITLQTLVEAGAHYGHQAAKWNPKMAPYIYGKRNKMHIIDMSKTMGSWERTEKFLTQAVLDGKQFLFVGTKRQAAPAIEKAAKDSDCMYVNHRWLGGLLTNFETIKQAIARLKDWENKLANDLTLTKKERGQITKNIEKKLKTIGGIRELRVAKNIVLIISDINQESLALQEARCLGFPVVAIVDTNTNPELVDYPIPANDDAVKTIELILNSISHLIQTVKSSRAPAISKDADDATNTLMRQAIAEKGD